MSTAPAARPFPGDAGRDEGCRWPCALRWSSAKRQACRGRLAPAIFPAPQRCCPGRPPRLGRSRRACGPGRRSAAPPPRERRRRRPRRWRLVLPSARGVIHDGPDLYGASARPALRQRKSLVEVFHIDDRKAPDDLLGLYEGAVGHDRLAILEGDRGRGVGALQLFSADDLSGPRVLLEPNADFGVGGQHLLSGLLVPLRLLFHRSAEQQHVLHTPPPRRAVRGAASLTRRTGKADFDRIKSRLTPALAWTGRT